MSDGNLLNKHLSGTLSSSAQGLFSGLGIGFFGASAIPFVFLTVPLDCDAISKWRTVPRQKSGQDRIRLIGSALFSMGINAICTFAGLSIIAPVSPLGSNARNQFFMIVATPVTAANYQQLSEKSKKLLSGESFWLSTDQVSKLKTKVATADKVGLAAQRDRGIYYSGLALAGTTVNKENFESVLNDAGALEKHPRSTIVLPSLTRAKISVIVKQALQMAEAVEKDRIARLPKKFKATMTNCFVDAPCESFERVGVVENGKVTVGDLTCPFEGRNDSDTTCSVVMDGGRPVSMQRWDPADGFVDTRVSFGGQVTDGSYDPEMEANPYVKLQRERVAQIVQEWGREKENAKRNCKGLKGDAWTRCAGAQSGN